MRRARGFTLVEALVTVSVVGVLLSIMLPALGRAREAGRTVVCASNARQLQMANDFHADANAGAYAPEAEDFRANNHRWHGVRDPATGVFEARVRGEGGAVEEGAIVGYLEGAETSRAVRACPTFGPTVEALREAGRGFEAGCGGYGYNNAFVGTPRVRTKGGFWGMARDGKGAALDWRGSFRREFARPSGTIAFADAALADDGAAEGVIEYSFIEPRRWPAWPVSRPDPSVHFRHAGSATVAWLDGHVSRERMAQTWTSGTYARDAGAAGVGWFGARDDNSLFDYE